MDAKEKVYAESEIPGKLAEHGLAGWYIEDGWLRRKYTTDGWPTTLMLVNTVGYLAEARHFVECIRTGCRPLSDGIAGAAVVSVLEHGQMSLIAGREVAIPPFEAERPTRRAHRLRRGHHYAPARCRRARATA